MLILPKSESGQALLLVLLSMAVILTAAFSVVSRSITDVSITTKDEDSLRAFSAAEAGLERAMLTGSDGSGGFGDASYTSIVTSTTGGKEFLLPVNLLSGDSSIVWFVGHDANENPVCGAGACFTGDAIRVCWGDDDTPNSSDTTPAMEIAVYYLETPGDLSTASVLREAVDPYMARPGTNSFDTPDGNNCLIGGKTLEFYEDVDLSPIASRISENGLQYVRLRPLYNNTQSHDVGVIVDDLLFPGNGNLPSQGRNISSTGIAGAGSTVNRKIEVFQGYGEYPSVFDSALFARGGATK